MDMQYGGLKVNKIYPEQRRACAFPTWADECDCGDTEEPDIYNARCRGKPGCHSGTAVIKRWEIHKPSVSVARTEWRTVNISIAHCGCGVMQICPQAKRRKKGKFGHSWHSRRVFWADCYFLCIIIITDTNESLFLRPNQWLYCKWTSLWILFFFFLQWLWELNFLAI